MYEMKVLNVAIVSICAVIGFTSMVFGITTASTQKNDENKQIEIARLKACSTIEDQTIRSFCIVGLQNEEE